MINPPPNPPAEPGYTTTEFWALVASFVWAVLGTVLAQHGVTQDQVTQWSTLVAPIAAGIYALARSIRKSGTPG